MRFSSTRFGSMLVVALAAVVVLACGPSSEIGPGEGGGVILPAVERPDGLGDYLDLPDGVEEVVYPWSQVAIERASGSVDVGVLVANTGERRSRGMMHWTGLPADSGMIFIWEQTQARTGGFWNPDVPIDLHVAWLGRDGTILEFSTLIANDRTVKSPSQEYYFVLEMPHGRFEEMGIAVGDRVVIPETLLPDEGG